jgi:murein DD-endopeptidase MepM/ murein hydrolase activator NlpD
MKGIFICKNPQSSLEILLYEENKFLLGKHDKLCYNINNKVLFFLPNMRFTATTRAFFIDSNIFMPLEKSNITSDYGMRISPISGNWKFHKGIDLGASEGTPVYACKNGKVAVCVKNDKTFGNYIILSHSNGMTSVYAHLSKINVKKDEIIRKGYQIGNVGSTGAVTGPHLHFEIRKNGIATNPFDFIKK